ncbi:DUF7507 domain-containing protein [Maribellus mangrovi]|uniref:DUF7507 domain-containing protein n=1 Tax=Maribellus mangrovi TaxID=3133146 RepID=UPI0030ED570C
MQNSTCKTNSSKVFRISGLFVLLLFITGFSQTLNAQNRIIVNPSFETGAGIPHNGVAYLESQVGDNPQIDGWYSTHPIFNGAEGAIEHWQSGFNSVPAQEGGYFVELNVSQSSRLYQIVFLVNGETIDWEYYHRQRDANATETVQYSIYSEDGSSKLYTIDTHTASSTSSWDHRTGTYTFTGTTGVYQIGFESTTAGGSGNFLDNVTIGLKALTEFSHSTVTINESQAASFDPHFIINGAVKSVSSVTFTVISSDADEGIDYNFPTKTISVPVKDYGIADSISLGFSLVDDSKGRGDRTIQINLSSASGDVDDLDANGDGFKNTLTIHVIDDDPSPGDVPKAELWLDASDPDADGNPGNNPADNTDVTTWADKSGNDNDVTTAGISQGGVNPPSYLNDQFNGQAALRFDKVNSEALGKILDTDYVGDFTIFMVLQGQTATPADFDAFFSSWNVPGNANSFQIDYLASSQNFQVRTTHGNVAFGPVNQELDLFTVRMENTTLGTYSDGVLQNQSDFGSGNTLGFNAYRIGANRNADRFYDSKIAEVIIYPRALTACEMEQVNDYLGAKYGRDYYDIAGNFNNATFPNDATGISAFTSACSGLKQINTATSNILTIDNPSSNDTQGEFLIFAHDGEALAETTTNVPLNLGGSQRIGRSWIADRNGDVGTVDLHFDLSGITVSGTQAADMLLIVDNDGDGDFTTGNISEIPVTDFSGNVATITGTNLPDGAVFSLITFNNEDFDNDGVPNSRDDDDDNDGILDRDEGYGSVIPQNPVSTVSYSTSQTPANGPSITTPSTGYTITSNNSPGKFAFTATAPGESGSGSGTGTVSRVTIDVDFAPQEVVSNVQVSVSVGSFDDGLFLEVDGVNIVNFDQSDWNNSTFNAKFGGGSTWTPWNGTGNPALELDLINQTVALMVDVTDGSSPARQDALAFISGSKPNPVPAVDFDAGVTIGSAFQNNSGPGAISAQTLTFSADVTTHQLSGSGTWDFQNLDSDKDGCFDVKEAGFTDPDGDGILGTSPVTVDVNGRVTSGVDGYTTPRDGDNNGTKDFQEVGAGYTVSTQPADTVTVSVFDAGQLFVVASGSPANYQWQLSTDGGATFNDIADGANYSGAQNDTLQLLDVPITFNGNKYRVKLSNAAFACDTATSTVSVLQVKSQPGGVPGTNLWLKADAGTTPTSGTLTAWQDHTGSQTTTISGDPQLSDNGVNFNPTVAFDGTDDAIQSPYSASLNTATFTINTVFKVTGGSGYRAVVSSKNAAFEGYVLYVHDSNIEFWVGQGGSSWTQLNGGAVPLNQYVQVTAKYDGTNAFLKVNGVEVATSAATYQQQSNFTFRVGMGQGNTDDLSFPFIGEIPEIIYYPSALSVDDQKKVESYLDLKYGISMGNNRNAALYVNSGGQSIYIGTTYKYDIFGVGKDDGSGLEQSSSNSMNTGSGNGTGQSGKCNIQIAGAASLDDGDFLIIGNDGGALSEQTTGLPTSLSGYLRLGRQWKVKRTGDLTNNFIFDLNGLSLIGSASSDFKLIVDVDGDGDFTTGTVTEYNGIYVNNTLTFLALDLPDGSVFTLVTGLGNPDWTFTKETTSTSYSQVNEALIYKLTLSNTGNVDISNIQLDDPGSLNPIIFPNTNEDANSDGLLNPGEVWTAVYPHPVTQADLDAGSYTNIATASGSSAVGPPPTLSDTVTVNAIQEPQILLEISADTLVYGAVGESITFKLKASNTGNVSLDSVSLDYIINPISWEVGTMLPLASDSIEVSYSIKQEDLDRGFITYGTTIYGVGPNGARVSYYDEIFLTADQRPSFDILKTTLVPDFRSVGDIQFEIVSTNTGNVTLGQVALIDSLVNLTKSLPDMAPNDVHTDTVTYSVTQADLDAREVTNIATIYGRLGNNGLEVTDKDTVTIGGVPLPAIKLVKTADATSYNKVGHTITYTFTAKNTGNVTLSNVMLDDPLTGTSAENLGTIAPGDSAKFTADYNITQADIDAGSLTNIATLSGTDPVSTVVSAMDTLTINAIQSPEIILEKAAIEQNFDASGDVINYVLEVKNPGNVTLTDVHVLDPLAGIDTILTTPVLPSSYVFLGGMHSVDQLEIDAGYITNVATVTALDPNSQSLSDTASVTVTANQNPSIDLSKTADTLSYGQAGDVIHYEVSIENTGNVTLTNVQVNDPLAGISASYLSISPGYVDVLTGSYTITQTDIDTGYVMNAAEVVGEGAGATVQAGDQVKVFALQAPNIELTKTVDSTVFFLAGDTAEYKFEIENTGNVTLTNIQLDDPRIPYQANIVQLLPGESWTDSVKYELTQTDVDAQIVKNTATVSATSPDGTPVDASDDAYITIDGVGALEVIKITETKQYSTPGDSVKFALGIFNIGNVTLENVVMTDSLTGQTWNIGTMDPFTYLVYEVGYEATQADIDFGTIRNVASATGNTTLGDPVSALDEAISKAVTSSAIDIAKKAKVKTFDSVGDVISYTITVSNAGNTTLSNVVLTDTLTGLTQPLGTMAPGDIQTVSTSYTIKQADMDRGVLYNTATVIANNPKGASIENQDTEKVSALQSPSIGITKTVSDTTYDATSDVLTYNLTVENTGNVTLSDVQVVDFLISLDTTLSSLAPGVQTSFTGSYNITQNDIDAGQVDNGAIASGISPKKVNVYDIANLTVFAVQNPKLTLSKTSQKTSVSLVGEILDYTLQVENTGNVTLIGVQVEDPLTGTSVNLGTLAPQAMQNIQTKYTVQQTDLDNGQITNVATAFGSDPGLVKISSTDSATVTAVQNPLMKLTKTAAQTNYKALGDKIDYTITLENTGNVTLNNPEITDPLTGANQTWPSVPPKGVKTVNASYFITQADLDAGFVTNVADASANAPDLTTLNKSDSVTVVALQAPSIKFDKTVTPTLVENAGDSVEYTFVIRNNGNVTLTDLNLTDAKIPVDLDFPIISPGGVWTVSLDYEVTQQDIDGLIIPNTAYVSADGPNSTVTDKDHALVAVKDNGAIEVVKTTSDSIYAAPGDRLRYTVDVSNIGNITLADVVITDSLTNNTWTIDTLAPGASQQFLSVYNVVQDDIDRGTVVNLAKVTAKEATPLGRVVEWEDDVTSAAARNASFELNKSATVNTYSKAGEVIRYNLEVKNTGNVTLENITVTDTLTGTSQIIASLAPNTSQTIPVDYTITQADVDRDSVVNTATITGDEVVLTKSATLKSGAQAMAGTLADDDTYVIYAIQTPGIDIQKTADKSNYSSSGEVIDYTLEVSNTGNVTLHDVTVTDTLTNTNWNIGVMAPGDIMTYNGLYAIKQKDMDTGSLHNEAKVTAVTPQNTTLIAIDSLRINADQFPAIILSKASDINTFSNVGDVITYTLEVINQGNVTLENVTVVDPLTGTNTNLGTIAPRSSRLVVAPYVTTQADLDAGVVQNTATVSGTDPKGSNVNAMDVQLVLALQAPALNFEKTASPTLVVQAGDPITYTFTATNTGNTTLSNLTLIDARIQFRKQKASLDPGETWTETVVYTTTQQDIDGLIISNDAQINATTPNGLIIQQDDQALVAIFGKGGVEIVKTTFDPLYSLPGDTLHYEMLVTNIGNLSLSNVVVNDALTGDNWSLGAMAPGADSLLTSTYVVTQADIDSGQVLNTAHVSGTTPIGNTVESTDGILSVAMRAAGLSVAKYASSQTYSMVGETITYTMEVENGGNVTLNNVVVNDPLTGTSQTYATMAPGDGQTITADYAITQDDLDKGSILNTVNVLADNSAGPPISSNASCVIVADQQPGIEISKVADRSDYSAVGDVVNFTLTVNNTGNVRLTNVNLNDPLTGLSLVIDTIQADDSVVVNTSYSIVQKDLDAGTLTNIASVLGTSPRKFSVNDETSLTLSAVQMPEIEMEKVASRTNYDTAGDLINYTLTVRNTGNVILNNVQISDPLTGTNKLLPILAPGAQNVSNAAYFIQQSDIDNGSLINIANVVAADPSGTQVSDADTVTLAAIPKPFIDVTKTADVSDFDAVGDVITYNVSVRNTGNETLNNLQLEDPLTGLSEFVDTLRVAQTVSFPASYTITQADLNSSQVVNVATAIASDPANNTVADSDTLTVMAVQNPQLSISMTASPTQYSALGDLINYDQKVRNTGNVTLDSVMVADPLTGQLDLIGTMAPGDSASLSTSYAIAQIDLDAGTLVNTATVTGDGPSGTSAMASASFTINGQQTRGISLEKTAEAPYYRAYGEAIYYTFTIRNLGNVTLTNVVLKDPLLGFTKTYPTLNTSLTETVRKYYCVDHSDLKRGYITNIAELSYNDPTLGKVTVKDTATVTLIGKADVTFEKTVKNEYFEEIGDTIQYSLRITNTGEVSAYRIKVMDPLTGLDVNIASLDPAMSKTISTDYIVTQTDVDGHSILNKAKIIAYDPLNRQLIREDSVFVYLKDTIPTTVLCKDTAVVLDDQGLAMISAEMIDNGSSDNNSGWQMTLSQTDFTCADVGVNEIVLYVTDAGGNVDSCTATVTVYDRQTPQLWCIGDTVLQAEADACGYPIDSTEFDPKATDNCDVNIWNTLNNDTTLAGELLPVGEHEIMWYAEDAGGKVDSCMFKVTVVDKVAPLLVCPADTTIGIASDLDSAWIGLEIPVVMDNCDEFDLVNDYTGTNDASGMYPVGATTVTYTVSDTSGNTETCSFVVILENNPVGIDDQDKADFKVNLYPNPTKGLVNVEIEAPRMEDVEIIVRSVNGQEVFRKTYLATDQVNFDLSDHVSGMYLIQIETGEYHVVKKLILDRK